MTKGDKYIKLKRFLEQSHEPHIRLTFAEIEKIVGDTLPESATKHAEAWWSNNRDHSQAIAWLDAGYETDFVTDTYPLQAIVFVKR